MAPRATPSDQFAHVECLMALVDELGVAGTMVHVAFRRRHVWALASMNPGFTAHHRRTDSPITEPLALELASGSNENYDWERPVLIHALLEVGTDARQTLLRASRWASYAARVAVAPRDRISPTLKLEASLRGIWLITSQGSVVIHGESGATQGSIRGLDHRLLDECAWAALRLDGER